MIGDEKKSEGLPGDEEPVIEIGIGYKMPKTPDLMSVEGLEDVKSPSPFLSPFGK